MSPTTTQYMYDALGSIDALGSLTTYSYDYTYDVMHNGNTTTYMYDLLDLITAPGGSVTTYTYDFSGSIAPTLIPLDYLLTYTFDAQDSLGLNMSDSTTANIQIAPIPEPASLGLIVLGAVPLLRRRRTTSC